MMLSQMDFAPRITPQSAALQVLVQEGERDELEGAPGKEGVPLNFRKMHRCRVRNAYADRIKVLNSSKSPSDARKQPIPATSFADGIEIQAA